jgi:hypothetical protein
MKARRNIQWARENVSNDLEFLGNLLTELEEVASDDLREVSLIEETNKA